MTRRSFLAATLSGGAALVGGGLSVLGHPSLASATTHAPWIEKSIPELQALMLPLFSYWLYPAVEKVVRLTPLRKIGAGLFVTAASFFLVAMQDEVVFPAFGINSEIFWRRCSELVRDHGWRGSKAATAGSMWLNSCSLPASSA